MFGCCVAGRLLQTNMTQVDQTHAYFELTNAHTINHICVFLLGDVPFPPGYGAAVHFLWPGKGFQLLGMISNDKPSAIFRVKSTYNENSSSAASNRFSEYSTSPEAGQNVVAILGLSIEPLADIEQQLLNMPGAAGGAVSTDLAKSPGALAEKIVKHLINYMAGFAGGTPITANTTVPLSLIERWYETFMGKLKAGGVGFLEREN